MNVVLADEFRDGNVLQDRIRGITPAAGGGGLMSEKKDFDCVEMKARIQAQLLEEAERLGEEEAHRMQWERAPRSPAPGEFIERLHEREPAKTR